MKRIAQLVVVVTLVIILAACGNVNTISNTENTDSNTGNSVASSVKTETSSEAYKKQDSGIENVTLDEIEEANRVYNIVQAGSNKAVHIKIETDNKSQNSDIYSWVDSKGFIHQYTNGSKESYTVINKDGIAYQYSWDNKGKTETNIITDGASYYENNSSLYFMYNSEMLDELSEVKDTEAKYKTRIKQSEKVYELYLDSKLKIKACILDESQGYRESSTVEIVDVPSMDSFKQAFNNESTLKCNFKVDGADNIVDIYGGDTIKITTTNDNAMITAGAEVNVKDGSETLDLKSGSPFILKEDNNFVIIDKGIDAVESEQISK